MIWNSERRLWLPHRLAGTPRSQRGSIGIMAQRQPMKAAGGFSPPAFPSFLSDYNADLGTYSDTGFTTAQNTNGGAVKGWKDQNANANPVSGNTNCVLNTSGPNGHRSVDSTEYATGLRSSAISDTVVTIYMVCQVIAFDNVALFGNQNGTNIGINCNSVPSSNVQIRGGSGLGTKLLISGSTWLVLTAIYDTTNVIRVNLGTRTTDTGLGAGTLNGYTLSNDNRLLGNGTTARFARVLTYGANHSTGNQDTIVTALKSLYGIA